MASYNRVIVIGNLTKDPELRRIPSGTAVCELRLAINENFRNKGGEIIEKTVFVDAVLWDKQAEIASKYLSKGSPVFIEGRLQYDEWKTPQDETRSKLRIVCSRMQLIGAPTQQRSSQQQPSPTPNPGSFGDEAPAPASEPDDFDGDDDIPPF